MSNESKKAALLDTIRKRLNEMTPEEIIAQLKDSHCDGPTVEEFIAGFEWPQVYLAGFDVFRKDAIEHGQYLKGLCSKEALVGMYPFDNEVDQALAPAQMAAQISSMNMDMIKRADAVLANLNCFRGLEPDSGTVFEVGMAIAMGKPVWVYFDGPETLRDLVPHDADGFDAEGFMVENFSLPMNLMLACTWAGHSKSVEEAVPELAKLLWAQKRQKELERQSYLSMIEEADENLLLDASRQAVTDDEVSIDIIDLKTIIEYLDDAETHQKDVLRRIQDLIEDRSDAVGAYGRIKFREERLESIKALKGRILSVLQLRGKPSEKGAN